MEQNLQPPLVEGRITDIRFSVGTDDEVHISSVSEGPISNSSQLKNPFLGLPLESGRCESCWTTKPEECEGHFGYIELPIPIYHPSHVTELKNILNLICLKCRNIRSVKNVKTKKTSSSACKNCTDFPIIIVKEHKTMDGVSLLELNLKDEKDLCNDFWNFLDCYGYRYGNGNSRILLPCEALEIIKRLPQDTKTKLSSKCYFPQDGYILQKLPVPPNCLSTPYISDGVSITSSDMPMLRKIIMQSNNIKQSRSGTPSFEANKVEVTVLQSTVAKYIHARGIPKDSRVSNLRSGSKKSAVKFATKAWREKMATLFISKPSKSCSRSVITGDAYRSVYEIGLPLEVARNITFQEKVTTHNKIRLQELVDKKLCLSYNDGASTYSLREASKGHTSLKVGYVVERRIMDGDIVLINQQPTTHRHSFQALSVYLHEDQTVKIHPLICGPLDGDFDGDCVHVFYPQSLAARAEVMELFSADEQLVSSHNDRMIFSFNNDSLLSLKVMFKICFLDKINSNYLAMFLSRSLPQPAMLVKSSIGPRWTVFQIIQTALPDKFDYCSKKCVIEQSEILEIDCNSDTLQSVFFEIFSAVFVKMGSIAAVEFLNSLQPMLMEYIHEQGYSVSLTDFIIPSRILEDVSRCIQELSPLLQELIPTHNDLVESQVQTGLRRAKALIVNNFVKSSGLRDLIDCKSESAMNKVVEQIGFLGRQLFNRGKSYSRNSVEEVTSFFLRGHTVSGVQIPVEAFGVVRSNFVGGLNPYESFVHSISSREMLRRSSNFAEPGTLFKNLMTILRDVVVCYDGTVRNACSNSVIQFEYGERAAMNSNSFSFSAGDPVGILAATAISDLLYKATRNSSPTSIASFELMKETLTPKIIPKNIIDRRIILYLNDCDCSKKHCQEKAAYQVQNQLKRTSLRDISVDFLIEYQIQQSSQDIREKESSLIGHNHLDEKRLKRMNQSMHDVLLRCQETINEETINALPRRKKSRLFDFLKCITLSESENCCFQQSHNSNCHRFPCLQFRWSLDTSELSLEEIVQIMANMILPILLDTPITGDRRVRSVSIIWISSDSATWVKKGQNTQKGELALELVLEKKFVKKHGDSWRLSLDACLPVIHLIDTRRSVPYAIRQLQETIGISCAFEQALARLATSFRMVKKDVKREYLILAANTMTCVGSLIGFSYSGYKALYRSLKVQLPFTEATLSAPRQCFEEAAEKYHADSLSSIVASSAWGKHVAVGTGSHFEILAKKTLIGLDQNTDMDVYDLLQLLTVGPSEGVSNTLCLGEDCDDLVVENIVDDQSFGYWKSTFDDAEIHFKVEQHVSEPHAAVESDKAKICDTWGKIIGKATPSSWDPSEQVNNSTIENQQTHDTWVSKSGGEWTKYGQANEGKDSSFTSARGRGRNTRGARGWAKSSSWKQNRAKQSGKLHYWNAGGNFTQYTSEERNILSDVNPIMQAIRRIMHHSEYNDGDRLSPDDQSFILDNVLCYHPDKAKKFSLGVDYITICKHATFQDTRCLHIVSGDGSKEDFSYRKCLDNFVKQKYPELALSFLEKYFERKSIVQNLEGSSYQEVVAANRDLQQHLL